VSVRRFVVKRRALMAVEQPSSPEDRLGQYLKTIRREESDGAGSTEGARRVEAIIAELGLPAVREDSAVWRIDADVGPVRAGVSDDGQVVTLWQTVSPLNDPKPKKNADLFHELLLVNRNTNGACIALDSDLGDDQTWIVILARLRAPTLDKPEFAMAIEDVFATSKLFEGAPDRKLGVRDGGALARVGHPARRGQGARLASTSGHASPGQDAQEALQIVTFSYSKGALRARKLHQLGA
jgi:hypothetical protein